MDVDMAIDYWGQTRVINRSWHHAGINWDLIGVEPEPMGAWHMPKKQTPRKYMLAFLPRAF